MRKKFISMMLAGIMAFSLAACGGGDEPSSNSNSNANQSSTNKDTNDGDDKDKDSSSSDMSIAMITDSGDITDQSFNQTTYEASKAWSEENSVKFNYYKPESDSDESRNASVDQAIADGANIIVMPGYMFAAAVVSQSDMYPDVKFIALDVGAGDICEKGVGEGYDYNPDNYNVADYYNTDNVYCCTYQEEISGYMAGYAAVKLGYKHLGFLGGMSVPAVTRFGYGYLQGADDAAEDMGITDEISAEYVCGGQFYGDADITAYMDTWYGSKGVDIVFACGGGIYTSAAEAAVKTGGKLIGVDSDQSAIIDSFGKDLTVTSAMKGLAATIKTVLTDIKDGKWDDYKGKIDNLGLVSENPEENYVQLPLETTQWGDGFTKDDYLTLVKSLYNGETKVSNDITELPKTGIKVSDYGSIK